MLAYVFWHWARPEVGPGQCEAALAHFHAALVGAAPAGYLGSRSFAVADGVPGVACPGLLFEDWYFLDGFGALGSLNESAVARRAQAAHAEVARLAGGGAGGVYRLRTQRVADPSYSSWIDKPAAETYPSFLTRFAAGVELWQRQMVLGPAPEFCALAEARSTIDGLEGAVRGLKTVVRSSRETLSE